MSNVLLVDGNPDHIKALSGLFKYRIKHDLDIVEDCVSALRHIYRNPPDVVLVNALLFASEGYGFPRAMAEDPTIAASSRVVVLISGRLDEIRERAVARFGASILELPASADELNEAIEKARSLRSPSGTPRAVAWERVDSDEQAQPEEKREAQPLVQRVSWQPLSSGKTDDGRNIRAVNWATDGGESPSQSKPAKRSRPRRKPAPEPEEPNPVIKSGGESFRPAFTPGGDGFRPFSDSRKAKEKVEEEAPKPFSASDFKDLKGVDPGNVKNR